LKKGLKKAGWCPKVMEKLFHWLTTRRKRAEGGTEEQNLRSYSNKNYLCMDG
jgi:hypothetical protein